MHYFYEKTGIQNLGVLLESDFSMTAQINNLRKSMYFQLQKISSVRPFLTQSAAQTLITTLVLSKLDYCNAILSGVTMENVSKLQTVQNHAAKLILRRKKSDHVTPILKELHWLPVDARINYNICFTGINISTNKRSDHRPLADFQPLKTSKYRFL